MIQIRLRCVAPTIRFDVLLVTPDSSEYLLVGRKTSSLDDAFLTCVEYWQKTALSMNMPCKLDEACQYLVADMEKGDEEYTGLNKWMADEFMKRMKGK